jgi:hypothetical protein
MRAEGLRFLESQTGPPMMTEGEFDRFHAGLLQQRAVRKAAGAKRLESVALEGIIPSVSDHSLDRYIIKIDTRLKQ